VQSILYDLSVSEANKKKKIKPLAKIVFQYPINTKASNNPIISWILCVCIVTELFFFGEGE
jgi:hypothetical protein